MVCRVTLKLKPTYLCSLQLFAAVMIENKYKIEPSEPVSEPPNPELLDSDSPNPIRSSELDSHRPINGERLDQSVNNGICQNCALQLDSDSNFCSNCGQKKVTHRISFGRLLKETPQQFFQLDRGLLLTIVRMFRDPGRMARDYVYGQRKRYVSPVTYFLIGASIQLLAVWFSADQMKASIAKSIESQELPNEEKLKEIFGGDIANGFGDVYLAAIAQSYTYAAVIFFALPLAFCLWQSQKLVGSGYRYGEVLVFAFYLVGHLMIVTAFVSPIAIRISQTAATLVGPSFYLGYMLYAHGGFFANGIKARGLSLASMFIAMLIFFSSIAAIFIVSLVATIAFSMWN